MRTLNTQRKAQKKGKSSNLFLGPLSFFFGFFFIVALIITSIQSVVFDHDFYLNLYQRLDWAKQIQVSQEDLESSIFMMVDYVKGTRDDLDGKIIWKKKQQATFNTKEIRHMKDVKKLWQTTQKVMIGCWILMIICGGLVLWFQKRQGFFWLFEGFKASLLFFCFALFLLGFWCFTDFTSFWTWFHTIVFPGNTDWLLNPTTDFMIVICPEEMFSTMIFQIILRLLLGLSLFYLIARFIVHFLNKAQLLKGENK